jgi:hypothetical protein
MEGVYETFNCLSVLSICLQYRGPCSLDVCAFYNKNLTNCTAWRWSQFSPAGCLVGALTTDQN